MPVKLIVYQKDTKTSDEREYSFDDDIITIGRDNSNRLSLPDLKKSISRKHAQIEFKNNAYQLVDCNSKNGTTLNNTSLNPGQPSQLHNNNQFTIGDFNITFFITRPSPHQLDVSPISEELTDTFKKISNHFILEQPDKRTAILQRAIQTSVGQLTEQEIETVQAVIKQLDLHINSDTTQRFDSAYDETNFAPQKSEEQIYKQSQVLGHSSDGFSAPHTNIDFQKTKEENLNLQQQNQQLLNEIDDLKTKLKLSKPPIVSLRSESQKIRAEKVIDMLLEINSKMLRIPLAFKTEIEGTTMMLTGDDFKIYNSSGDELKALLLAPNISEEQAHTTMSLLKKALEKDLFHQLALLDGYKKSTTEGTLKLLGEIDPEKLKQEISDDTFKLGPLEIPYRMIPFLLNSNLVKHYSKKHQELKADLVMLGRSIFLPSFLSGYHERIASAPSENV